MLLNSAHFSDSSSPSQQLLQAKTNGSGLKVRKKHSRWQSHILPHQHSLLISTKKRTGVSVRCLTLWCWRCSFPQNGRRNRDAFASTSLSPAEKKYAQLEKEGLAIVLGVKRFQQYLYGSGLKVRKKAFKVAKSHFTSSALLVDFDQEKELVLACDALPYGVVAVLSHKMEDGTEKPIAFASTFLSPAEKKYAQLE